MPPDLGPTRPCAATLRNEVSTTIGTSGSLPDAPSWPLMRIRDGIKMPELEYLPFVGPIDQHETGNLRRIRHRE